MSPRTRKPRDAYKAEILDFLRDYYLAHQDYPSFDQIASKVGIKSKGGHLKPILDEMVQEGLLEKAPGARGGVRLPRQGVLSIPMRGLIAADNQNPEMLLDHDPHDVIDLLAELLPERRLGSSRLFALQVRGDSMEGALIADGDTLLMEETSIWNEGDIVAAFLKNEGTVTLKEIRSARRGTVKLIAKSHKHHSRVEKLDEIQIMGRLVTVIRRYTKSA